MEGGGPGSRGAGATPLPPLRDSSTHRAGVQPWPRGRKGMELHKETSLVPGVAGAGLET